MYMYSLLVTTTHLIMAAEERRVCVGERERERERERDAVLWWGTGRVN